MSHFFALSRSPLRSGVCVLLLASCADSDSGVAPESAAHTAYLSEAAALWEPGVRAAHADILQETAAACGVVTITAGRPRRTHDERCAEEFLVDFTVEAERAELPVLDMFRSYPVVDWRIRTREGRVRHDLSLVWRPYGPTRVDGNLRRDRRRVTQPLTVRTCPGGAGPILACGATGCEIHETEEDVPPAYLPSQGVVFEAPWSYEEIRDLREGSTLRVPMRYHLPMGGEMSFRLFRVRRSSRGLAITPQVATVSGRSGTVTFRIRAERDTLAQEASVEEFGISLRSFRGFSGCEVLPNHVRVRVRDR